jgi:hypothetical protein
LGRANGGFVILIAILILIIFVLVVAAGRGQQKTHGLDQPWVLVKSFRLTSTDGVANDDDDCQTNGLMDVFQHWRKDKTAAPRRQARFCRALAGTSTDTLRQAANKPPDIYK